ncbi:hypothetical protein [Emticicia fluvialis]|uniref:hypothetical protein n=1 Tax=Emticicia fluvialis TaxID=2974474 RepID=UPI002165A42B|nr:hypothetical protein [Emticicia fluvialis]
MVTVTAYQQRTSVEGKDYFALELQSDDMEFVISQNTGRHYITTRKCWISSTFNESMCLKMLGKTMAGSITKTECEPYEFTIPETGEVITRQHRYDYSPVEQSSMEQVVMQKDELVFA